MYEIQKVYPGVSPLKGALYGLELELESYLGCPEGTHPTGTATVTEDGSLRNNGMEFISSPLNLASAARWHQQVLHDSHYIWGDTSERCHERCSIHVHVNMSDLPVLGAMNCVWWYWLLEPGFFNFIAPHRQNNIYCVPLSATSLVSKLSKESMPFWCNVWHKYTAFNIKPYGNLGTFEFRHMEATEDSEKVRKWLEILDEWRGLHSRELPRTFEEVLRVYYTVFGEVPSEEIQEQLKYHFTIYTLETNECSADMLVHRIKETEACLAEGS